MRRYHWSLPLVVGVLLLIATALVCVAVLGAVELALSLVMAHPPPRVQKIAQSYYRRWERYLIQFLPECAQYDPELTYILRPGVCRFRNREFDTEVRVNSRGFHSDESDLAAPIIVMAGDSYTMGWGVAQDSTFAALIGRRTGLRTLNTGVSSYGTARELLGLKRVDLSQARYLIIQYSDDDFGENRAFVASGGRLKVRNQRDHESIVSRHLNTARYYPGKYIRLFLPMIRDQDVDVPWPRDLQAEVAAFLGTLLLSPVRLDNLQIVVFEMIAHSSDFAARLEAEHPMDRYPSWIRRIKVVDIASRLSPDSFFFYDDHLTATGHRNDSPLYLLDARTPSASRGSSAADAAAGKKRGRPALTVRGSVSTRDARDSSTNAKIALRTHTRESRAFMGHLLRGASGDHDCRSGVSLPGHSREQLDKNGEPRQHHHEGCP